MFIEKTKPLNRCAYGSIPHMLGSNRGPADRGIEQHLHDIFTKKCHPRDRIVVQQKIDGSNVAIANIDGEIIALNRCGYEAKTSPYLNHRLFSDWVEVHPGLEELIQPGQRLCCEWIAMVHGTWYTDATFPIYAFDLFDRNNKRILSGHLQELMTEFRNWMHVAPELISTRGKSVPIEQAMELSKNAPTTKSIDAPEGVVYRLEGGRNGSDSFRTIAKYVRSDFVPGRMLPDIHPSGEAAWLFDPCEFGTPDTRWLAADLTCPHILKDIHNDTITLREDQDVRWGDYFHQDRNKLTQFRAGKVLKTITIG